MLLRAGGSDGGDSGAGGEFCHIVRKASFFLY